MSEAIERGQMENRRCAAKAFCTIDELCDKLELRGVSVDADSRNILMSEGYYSVINGYKDLFIDKQRTGNFKEDKYKEATHFNDIYRLFLFDRELRHLYFRYLIEIETTLRTIVVHSFCEQYPDEVEAYSYRENYTADFRLERFIGTLESLRTSTSRHKHESIIHHRDTYGQVPLWVIANHLTFGNISIFFGLCPPAIQSRACRMLREFWNHSRPDNPRGVVGTAEFRTTLSKLSAVRNKCAHDERLYCARIWDLRIKDIPKYMEMTLSSASWEAFSIELDCLFAKYRGGFNTASFDDVLECMGY